MTWRLPGSPVPAGPAPLLEARGLVVCRRGTRVLDGIDLALEAGGRVGLEGAVGAGKSTLLLALLGLVPREAGRLLADGRPLDDEASLAGVRRRVGLLFQASDDQLFHARVAQDVAFGPRAAGLDAAAAAHAAQAALAELGIAALHDAPVRALSGGQKRLVALAGLIAMRPRALLLDEPTAGLDAATRTRVLEWLCASPLALLVASHDVGCLDALCERRLVLEGGRLRDVRRSRDTMLGANGSVSPDVPAHGAADGRPRAAQATAPPTAAGEG